MNDAIREAARTPKVKKREFEAVVPELRAALLHLQEDLMEAGFPVLIVLDGDDLAGCDGAFERLHEWLDARYLRSEAFGPPRPEDEAFPWMRRYWLATPPRGWIGVHMRAWTNDLVRRAAFEDLDPGEVERRLEHVRVFEKSLVDDGCLLLKFWVHLPRKLLKRRLRDAAAKRDWRVQPEQRIVFERWSEALPEAERILLATDTDAAPWVTIDGDDARSRDLAIARHLEGALRARLEAVRAAPQPATVRPQRLKRDPRTALDDLDLTESLDDQSYDRKLKRWQARLAQAHRDASAHDIPIVLMFEGWDAAGKGGAIRRLTAAMDATRYRVFPITAPSEIERAHHWLWRFWRRVPRDGTVSIFDRSWYGRVLVERVEGFAAPAAWQRAYAEIEDFEAQLVEHGAVLVKFWLHIDADEQARRFEQRRETPFKRYKITPEDWRNRERWHDYEQAVADAVAATGSVARWNLVPAVDKRYARVEVVRRVTKAITDRLEKD